MDADEFLTSLQQAIDSDRLGDARGLLGQLDPGQFEAKQAASALGLYRRKRLFEELEVAATSFFSAGLNAPILTRYYSQALLDQGRLFSALATLRRVKDAVVADEKEGPEIRGLIGRGLKQQFVDEGNAKALALAIEAYDEDGRAAPSKHRWHGINLVACMMRAERDGIDVPRPRDPKALARSLLDTIAEITEPQVWDEATALEAAVALDDREAALKWLERYAPDERADAFELGSTLRQLKEIWQIEDSDLGGAILPVLEAELLKRHGGVVSPSAAPRDPAGFEAVYGDQSAQQMRWLDTLYERCLAIARIQNSANGLAAGTGFLASGEWFGETGWPSAPLLVTNSHVVGERPSDHPAVAPRHAEAEFTRLPDRPRAKLGKLLYSSPREELDISVFEIDPPPGADPLSLTRYTPRAGPGEDAARVFVAGHGEGRELSVTLYDNQLREVQPPYARYRCPTVEGHSGSPVLNETWDTFALHHRAVEETQLNEGVLLNAIRLAVQGGTP